MGRSADGLGDKLGPRLVSLITQATVASRQALAPHEARVRQAATQAIIDKIGREAADLFQPFTAAALASDDLHPHVRRFVERTASGSHQAESVLGHALLGMVGGSVFSTVIGNELAPIAYGLVGLNPHLQPDPATVAELSAFGWYPEARAELAAREQGYNVGWFHALWNAAFSWPAIEQILALFNRGGISQNEATLWMEHAGIHPLARPQLLGLARVLTTPADAALAVVRNVITLGEGEAIAKQSGLHAPDFRLLEAITGEPLGLMQLLEAKRRGFIDDAMLRKGILESRVRNEWIPTAEKLAYAPIPTADAIDAWLRGHLGEAEARVIAEQNGIEPNQVAILEANAGSPPGDVQVLELLRRGKISEPQAVEMLRFGRLRDQFIPAIMGLKYSPLPAADAADAWLRGHIDTAQATAMMERAGLEPSDVPIALGNAGNPLGLMQLLEALRRGFIGRAEFVKGFRESRYRDEWLGTALELAHSPMSTADAVEASIQGWLTKEQAAVIAQQNGLAPADFEPLWLTAGEPLSRTELEQLYNRGVIGIGVVRQGLRESRLKLKYTADAEALHVRLAEPREIVTAVADGVIGREAAADMLADHGFDKATVAMLIASGEVKSTGPHRALMTGEISKLYADRIIDEATAIGLLEHLHYTAESAHLVLRLADYTAQRRILDSGIAAVKAHYLAHRIDDATAHGDLRAMGLPATSTELYLKVWRLDRIAKFRTLTEAQIVKANKLGLFVPHGELTDAQWTEANYDAAIGRLRGLGYNQVDAGLLLAGA